MEHKKYWRNEIWQMVKSRERGGGEIQRMENKRTNPKSVHTASTVLNSVRLLGTLLWPTKLSRGSSCVNISCLKVYKENGCQRDQECEKICRSK